MTQPLALAHWGPYSYVVTENGGERVPAFKIMNFCYKPETHLKMVYILTLSLQLKVTIFYL